MVLIGRVGIIENSLITGHNLHRWGKVKENPLIVVLTSHWIYKREGSSEGPISDPSREKDSSLIPRSEILMPVWGLDVI